MVGFSLNQFLTGEMIFVYRKKKGHGCSECTDPECVDNVGVSGRLAQLTDGCS